MSGKQVDCRLERQGNWKGEVDCKAEQFLKMLSKQWVEWRTAFLHQ